MANTYRGHLSNNNRVVTVNGETLDPALDVARRSPSGFMWGVDGGGAEQLAIAILAHEYNGTFSREWANQFSNQYIQKLDRDGEWELDGTEITEYLFDFDPSRETREEMFEHIENAAVEIDEIMGAERRNLYPGELEVVDEIAVRLDWLVDKFDEELQK